MADGRVKLACGLELFTADSICILDREIEGSGVGIVLTRKGINYVHLYESPFEVDETIGALIRAKASSWPQEPEANSNG